MQAKGRHGIDEVSIETAAIDETGAVEIQDGENENTDTETTVNSIEEYSDVVEEVENKAEAVSENVDEKSDTSVDDETEDESFFFAAAKHGGRNKGRIDFSRSGGSVTGRKGRRGAQ